MQQAQHLPYDTVQHHDNYDHVVNACRINEKIHKTLREILDGIGRSNEKIIYDAVLYISSKQLNLDNIIKDITNQINQTNDYIVLSNLKDCLKQLKEIGKVQSPLCDQVKNAWLYISQHDYKQSKILQRLSSGTIPIGERSIKDEYKIKIDEILDQEITDENKSKYFTALVNLKRQLAEHENYLKKLSDPD